MSESERASESTARPWRKVRHIDVSLGDCHKIETEAFSISAGRREGPFENKGHFHPSEAEYYVDEIHVVQIGMDRDYNTIDGGIANEADADLIVAAVNAHDLALRLAEAVLVHPDACLECYELAAEFQRVAEVTK